MRKRQSPPTTRRPTLTTFCQQRARHPFELSTPHLLQPRTNGDYLSIGDCRRTALAYRGRPRTLLEVLSDRIRNEPRAQGIHVPVTATALLMGIEALWDDQMKMVFRSCHCDVEQTTLLLNFGDASRRQIRWYATVDAVQHGDRLPLLALGRMDRR